MSIDPASAGKRNGKKWKGVTSVNSIFGAGEFICFFILPFLGLIFSIIWTLTEKKDSGKKD